MYTPPVVVDRFGQRFDFGRRPDESKVISEPLHQGSSDGDRTLQGKDGRIVSNLISHRREQPGRRCDRFLTVFISMKQPVP